MALFNAAAFVAAFFMFASPALADHFGPRSLFTKDLRDGYSETLVEQGFTNPNGLLVELFASQNGETWTLLLTYPNGVTCLIGVGKDWRAVTPELLKPMGLPI